MVSSTLGKKLYPKELQQAYPVEFYARDTLDVARDLLGTVLCRHLKGGRLLYGTIVEVEAYKADDPACHAFRGYTPRSSTLFGPPGFAYVYFIYGMYHCLNVVTETQGTAGAVLIRAVDSINANGPGRLCKQWKIDRVHNGVTLMEPGSALWIAPGESIAKTDIAVGPRIGLSVGADLPWRFCIAGHKALSRPMKSA
jgi:DNA-3-methyladenine glycosylase